MRPSDARAVFSADGASCRSATSCCPRRSRWKAPRVARSQWRGLSFRMARSDAVGFFAELIGLDCLFSSNSTPVPCAYSVCPMGEPASKAPTRSARETSSAKDRTCIFSITLCRMGLDRAHSRTQHVCDSLIALAANDKFKDLPLPRSQRRDAR